MKKVLLAVSAIVALAACSKSDSPTPPPPPQDLIQGNWTGVSIVKTGFIDNVAIDPTDTTGTKFLQSMSLNLYTGADDKDSVKGTYSDSLSLAGTYAFVDNEDTIPSTIDANLTLTGIPIPYEIKGDIVTLTQDSLVVSQGKKEAVDFGNGQTSDSTVTVVSFVRKSND